MLGPDPVPCDHVVFTDFDDVEGILVDLNTKKYYQLNETAMVIWKGLARGLPARDIAELLAATYEVTLPDALTNVEIALEELKSYKLVTLQRGSSAAKP